MRIPTAAMAAALVWAGTAAAEGPKTGPWTEKAAAAAQARGDAQSLKKDWRDWKAEVKVLKEQEREELAAAASSNAEPRAKAALRRSIKAKYAAARRSARQRRAPARAALRERLARGRAEVRRLRKGGPAGIKGSAPGR